MKTAIARGWLQSGVADVKQFNSSLNIMKDERFI